MQICVVLATDFPAIRSKVDRLFLGPPEAAGEASAAAAADRQAARAAPRGSWAAQGPGATTLSKVITTSVFCWSDVIRIGRPFSTAIQTR